MGQKSFAGAGRAVRGRISGRVQGVSFRASMCAEARRQSAAGRVRNSRDGTVEFLLQGTPAVVQSMLDWAGRGPPGAHVTGLDVHDVEYDPTLDTFEID